MGIQHWETWFTQLEAEATLQEHQKFQTEMEISLISDKSQWEEFFWDFSLEKSANISAYILKISTQFESIVCWDLLANNI